MKLPNLRTEKELWQKGYRFVCGIDEVGRGAWAGPVVAAAVIFPSDPDPRNLLRQLRKSNPKIRDSKQLLPYQRQALDKIIRKKCLAYCISEISVGIINREGIAKATQRAFRKCLKGLIPRADFVLIDAFHIKYVAKKNQKPIIKGDQKSVSIAAASIIAKVYRDNLMKKLHRRDKRYRFDLHKGYGTKKHQEAIKQFGLSLHHRKSFIPENFLVS